LIKVLEVSRKKVLPSLTKAAKLTENQAAQKQTCLKIVQASVQILVARHYLDYFNPDCLTVNFIRFSVYWQFIRPLLN